MNIEKHPSHSRWARHKEAIVTTLLAWAPLPPGRIIRRLMYRTIFEQIGISAQIDPSVKFVGAENIRIGNGARIDSGVCLKSLGQNSKIWIGDRARLLNAAFAEIEETTELIHAEVEEAANLLHQRFQAVNASVPHHLILQNLLHHLLNRIRQVMAVDTVAVLLQTEDGQQLSVHVTVGLEEEIAEGIQIPIGHGFAGRIAASRQLTIVDDLSTVEVVSPILRNKGIQSMLGVPLLSKDQVIGVFHIGTFVPRKFTREEAQLLQLVADRIGLAIKRLQISKPFTAKGSALVWQQCTSTCLHQKVSRTIKNFTFHSHHTSFLELAPPRYGLL